MGHEQFSVPAFGLVVRVDPYRVVASHPGDQLFVLDADYTRELSDLANQCCAVSNQTERRAN